MEAKKIYAVESHRIDSLEFNSGCFHYETHDNTEMCCYGFLKNTF